MCKCRGGNNFEGVDDNKSRSVLVFPAFSTTPSDSSVSLFVH